MAAVCKFESDTLQRFHRCVIRCIFSNTVKIRNIRIRAVAALRWLRLKYEISDLWRYAAVGRKIASAAGMCPFRHASSNPLFHSSFPVVYFRIRLEKTSPTAQCIAEGVRPIEKKISYPLCEPAPTRIGYLFLCMAELVYKNRADSIFLLQGTERV